MKILYTLYNENGTPGGHLFSIEHILSVLQGKIEIYVMFIGKKMPKVIANLPYKKFHVIPGFKEYEVIRKILDDIQPDIIHSFDARSYIRVSFYSLFKKCKLVITKPGGRSPGNGFPYKDANLYLISNRVNKNLLHQQQKKANEVFTFLQIVRFTITKHRQIIQSLNFIKKLRDLGMPIKCILAGTVNDEEEKSFAENYIEENRLRDVVTIITDSRVERGSDLLCMGDCIIGMGRSAMEAATLGKIVVVPNAQSDYPLLLDKDNFDELYKYNFSGRSQIKADEKEFSKIIKIIDDVNYREIKINEIKKLSLEYFELTDEIVSKYMQIYSNIKRDYIYQKLYKNILVYIKFFVGRCL